MSEVAGYEERRRPEAGREARWGVFNFDADHWLDIHFGTEAEARQAAGFLTQARLRPA